MTDTINTVRYFRGKRGGGHEFQQDGPRAIPDGLMSGPPSSTQSREGYGGTNVPGPVADFAPDLATSSARRLSRSGPDKYEDPWKRDLLYSLQRKGNVQQFAGFLPVANQAVLIRRAESRTYLLLQNTSVANNLFFALGYAPQVTAVGSTGFILLPNGGNYEPQTVSQEDIWVVATVANTTWVLAIANG